MSLSRTARMLEASTSARSVALMRCEALSVEDERRRIDRIGMFRDLTCEEEARFAELDDKLAAIRAEFHAAFREWSGGVSFDDAVRTLL